MFSKYIGSKFKLDMDKTDVFELCNIFIFFFNGFFINFKTLKLEKK